MAFLESQGNTLWWVVGTSKAHSTNDGASSFSTVNTTVGGVKIGQVVAYNGPSGSAGKIDVTNLGSTAKQFLMGLRDEGDISLDVIYDPSTVAGTNAHTELFLDRGTRTKRGWIIKVSTGGSTVGTKIGGRGFCTGFSITGAVDDAIKATMTLAITGPTVVSSFTSLLWTTAY